ncbi:MAG: MotA/TolQ/ExbB proton channel family protein [Minicystis sp.]
MIVERLLRIALAGSAWVLYLLLALSVVSLAAMVERWLFFRKHGGDTDALRRKLAPVLKNGDFDEAEKILEKSPAIEARVLVEALRWRDGGAEAVSDAIDSEVSAVRKELERGTALLGTLGNNAPFVGLLGTVLGVIEAFHHLGDGANKAAMSNVMSGIAEALVATGVGLFVALPAVVAYNLVQKRIGDIEGAVAALGKLVTAALKTHRARPAASARAEASGDDEGEEIVRQHVNGVVAASTAEAGA